MITLYMSPVTNKRGAKIKKSPDTKIFKPLRRKFNNRMNNISCVNWSDQSLKTLSSPMKITKADVLLKPERFPEDTTLSFDRRRHFCLNEGYSPLQICSIYIRLLWLAKDQRKQHNNRNISLFHRKNSHFGLVFSIFI
jgi:hypothetical protein